MKEILEKNYPESDYKRKDQLILMAQMYKKYTSLIEKDNFQET